jgi:hypothetical protein
MGHAGSHPQGSNRLHIFPHKWIPHHCRQAPLPHLPYAPCSLQTTKVCSVPRRHLVALSVEYSQNKNGEALHLVVVGAEGMCTVQCCFTSGPSYHGNCFTMGRERHQEYDLGSSNQCSLRDPQRFMRFLHWLQM